MKPDEAMASIQTEPGLIKDQIHNTHIAGLAEYIAFINEARAPEWTNDQARFLKDPVFFGGKHSRGHILAKTTFSMRRRNLFCGEIILPTFKRKE